MAGSKISVLIDVTVDRANKALSGFQSSVKNADGAVNKFKAGSSSAFSALQANAGALAVGAGGALVAFGIKAVGAFQETALAAGELRDKLGLTSEEASRYIEVAGDMGIATTDLESTIGRMNRTAATTPKAFDDIGASIVRNADGSTNVNETFLSTVDALNKIPDAAARAKAGQEIFGRSWMNIAEMVGQGADGLRRQLDTIETGKVIDDKEVARARKYRDALDALKGVGEELSIEIGGALVPLLTDLANATKYATDMARQLASIVPEKSGPYDVNLLSSLSDVLKETAHNGRILADVFLDIDYNPDAIKEATSAFDYQSVATRVAAATGRTLTEVSSDLADAAVELSDAVKAGMIARDKATAADKRAKQATDDLRNAIIAGINSSIGYRNAQASAADALVDYSTKANDGTTSSTDLAAAQRDAESAATDQAAAAVQLKEDQAAANGVTLSAEAKTSIYRTELIKLQGYMTGPLAAAVQGYIDSLGRIPPYVSTNVQVLQSGQQIGRGNWKMRAAGGPVAPHEAYIVNERGTEILQMGSQGGYVMDANKSRAAMGGGMGNGGTTIYLTVNSLDASAAGRQIVDALNAHYANGGRPPRAS